MAEHQLGLTQLWLYPPPGTGCHGDTGATQQGHLPAPPGTSSPWSWHPRHGAGRDLCVTEAALLPRRPGHVPPLCHRHGWHRPAACLGAFLA